MSDLVEAARRLSSAAALVIDLDDTLVDARRTRAEAFAAIDVVAVERFRTVPGEGVKHADAVLEQIWRGSPFAKEFIRLGCAATDALWVDFSGPGTLLAEIRRWVPGFRTRFWETLCDRAGAEHRGDRSVLVEGSSKSAGRGSAPSPGSPTRSRTCGPDYPSRC
jgi:hypothetical protein